MRPFSPHVLGFLIASGATAMTASAQPSMAECAARYENYDRYVLEQEFPDTESGLPFDFELRAMAARHRIESRGEPAEWALEGTMNKPGSVDWMFAAAEIEDCDQQLGLEPTALGGKMFGYKSGAEIKQPDNLACFAMLTILDQQEEARADATKPSARFDLRANRALAPLYLAGWSAEEIAALSGKVYGRFASRYAEANPQNPSGKLSGDGAINRFARACALAYPPLSTDLGSVPVGAVEEQCFRQRAAGRRCADGFTAAMQKSGG